ncbi:uncharacterized protein LOC125770925 [Anopheles funestus]|uniref:uncharacterized protein LOC125770925 n=1 Tax=Anopheles funestus TaxID=62324 RepID=UPI0020C6963E|nr:uncharacterized protein LOC125770925 [Anopheles funestus]XP_049296955.1 uncharacterized protein LOC125770925 [Anopheles funestus]XP_049296956.1 uncharacterized protein LOC125770925 [Anopheles funestus]XP_049296957.1 uncharacterized protein LOC125770925 [Anopheles funestus]XP_049296958.1 uncharacterized protein LOC125770925 [Anopheles funestus]XP_049296959.1 uncharacterized protein LOC125770925 [Anopheles funestus]XP_049296960.1 uncharacterized protein LOC125770925 [Anopheles funestus]XP_0
MRPGPGLVVMALAFISGARRGTGLQSSSASQSGKLGKVGEDNTGEGGALTRINPWLSACDLEQPNSAPDLQGQCSAGTLPVAWIDEGPGPPRCPPPCETFRTHATYNNKNSNKPYNIDNTKYNMENRLNDKQQCLDYLGDNEELSPAQICKKSSQSIETKLKTLRLRHCCERTVGSALHNAAYADVLYGGTNCTGRLTELLETDALAARITCEFTEVLIRYDCGQPYSIIHHCEDCKEAYRRWGCSVFIPYFTSRDDIKSVNNKTGNRDSDRATQGKSNAIFGDAANKQTEPNMNDANKQQLVKNISITVKSSRRKTQRVRIRPCLNVCQTVEQKCPYMLPGDRAPAYPTQYAGEPTFLCRDLNIEETGDQLRKSNNGPTGCCYDYCGSSPIDGLCARCDPLHNETQHPDSAALALSSEPPTISPSCPSITTPTSSSSLSEQCRLSQTAITFTATTSSPSTTTTATTTSRSSSSSTTASTTTTTTTTISSRRLTGDSASTTAMAVPSGSSPARAISSLLRALCALGSVYRTHTNGVQSWIAMVAVLTVGTELVAWTKQLVHLLVVL